MGMIFISHSSRNNAEAIGVRDWLVSNGWGPAQIFLDLDALGGGERWRQRLDEIGNNCEAVIVCLSDDWIRSPECAREFTHAESRGKPIFPIIVAPLTVKIPSFVSDIQFVNISDPTLAEGGFEKLKLGLKRAQIGPNHFGWPPPSDPARPPYRGLRSFEEDDAAIFFGRDAQITAGLDALRQIRGGDPHRILTIAAASGAGKSSFLKAGLLARLRRDEENFLILPTWRPGRDALGGETGLLKSLGLETPGRVVPALAAMQAAVIQRMQTFGVPGAGERPPPFLVLPLDQAEELFSAENSSALAAIDLFVQALAEKPDLLVIATIRSDSLGGLQADARIAGQLNLFNLPGLPPSAFKEVIEGPAALASPPIQIEPALTQRLIDDLDRADALPLLAFTLERLVADFSSGNLLELREYETGLGGISGAINAAVEAAMRRAEADPVLPGTRHELDTLARAAFIPWLVQLDEADASPKRRVARLSDIPSDAQPLIRHFIEERLLVASSSSGETVIEVSHEAVLRHWRGLAAWISEERIVLEGLSRIIRSAQEWSRQEKTLTDRSLDLLVHRGERLRAAEVYLQRKDMAQALRGLPMEYLTACRAAEDAVAAREKAQADREFRQRRRAARWQAMAALILVLGFAGLVAGGWYLVQGLRGIGHSNSMVLNAASREADDRNSNGLRRLKDGGARATRIALLGYADRPLSPVAQAADFRLGATIGRVQLPAVLEGHSGLVLFASFFPDGDRIITTSLDGTARIWRETETGWDSTPLEGHAGGVIFAAFSPDGARIVTASEDDTARVWHETDTGWDSTPLEGHEHFVNSAAFSPDGARIVTASDDNTARVWHETSAGWDSTPLEGHEDFVNSAAFSPDGARIVTASDDNTARVWYEKQEGWDSALLEGHEGQIFSATFSPDGTRIVTASSDSTARVWHGTETGWESTQLEGHLDYISYAVFSPDGSHIVTASADRTARIWNQTETGSWNSTSLEGHEEQIRLATWSPDGASIVTASDDGTARVWRDNGTRWDSMPLEGHGGQVASAAFSPDGTRIVTASLDRTARIWNEAGTGGWRSSPLEGHERNVLSADFALNGTLILTVSGDSTARVWSETEAGWDSAPLLGRGDWVDSVSLSRDGTRIVSTSRNDTARVWYRTGTGWDSKSLVGHRGMVASAAFSPDGARIVTASEDNTARVWHETDTGWDSTPLEGHQDFVWSAAFSPDGARIVTASADYTVRVWRETETGWDSTALLGHFFRVQSAAFSPDGDRIVSASWDGTARVWHETQNGWHSALLEGHEDFVNSAAFSPDGARIVTTSDDRTARVWQETGTGFWDSTSLERHLGPITSAAFSPDGARIVTASADSTARVWDVGWLLGDPWRERLNRAESEPLWPPLRQAACDRMRDASKVWVRDKPDSAPRLKHFHTELTEDDLRAVPLVRTMGYKAGDDVCEASEPHWFDALLTRILPRRWWSGLDWSD